MPGGSTTRATAFYCPRCNVRLHWPTPRDWATCAFCCDPRARAMGMSEPMEPLRDAAPITDWAPGELARWVVLAPGS